MTLDNLRYNLKYKYKLKAIVQISKRLYSGNNNLKAEKHYRDATYNNLKRIQKSVLVIRSLCIL